MTNEALKPKDHVEIAVRAVEIKLESIVAELRGRMQSADFAGVEAFDRAAAVMERKSEADNRKFALAGMEFKAHQATYDGLDRIVRAAAIALEDIKLARVRYRKTRERSELERLLILFEAEDAK